MLRGNYPATVDSKGRLKIPTAFKAFLDEKYGRDYYVTSLDGKSAQIYPFPVWQSKEEKLQALPSLNKSKKRFLRNINYYGQMEHADAQGRVLIPAVLRESASMRGEVAVMGCLDYLDVWNMERFREELEREPFTEQDENTLSNLGI